VINCVKGAFNLRNGALAGPDVRGAPNPGTGGYNGRECCLDDSVVCGATDDVSIHLLSQTNCKYYKTIEIYLVKRPESQYLVLFRNKTFPHLSVSYD
jgi:hypothetical protein